MEQIVKDLKKMMPFKDTVETGDIVLIAAKKPKMLVYALITDIDRDESKKDEWWKISMQMLNTNTHKKLTETSIAAGRNHNNPRRRFADSVEMFWGGRSDPFTSDSPVDLEIAPQAFSRRQPTYPR